MLYLTILLAWGLLVVFLRLYLILNFWMYSLHMKIWFIDETQVDAGGARGRNASRQADWRAGRQAGWRAGELALHR